MTYVTPLPIPVLETPRLALRLGATLETTLQDDKGHDNVLRHPATHHATALPEGT